jgi:hypothetical protein
MTIEYKKIKCYKIVIWCEKSTDGIFQIFKLKCPTSQRIKTMCPICKKEHLMKILETSQVEKDGAVIHHKNEGDPS